MKASLVTSAALHALVISWALFSLSAPHTMEVADVEALPVDIVPVESITQIQKGEKKAPKKDISAPKPTSRPEPVKDAQEVGDNTVDLKTQSTPKPSARPVEAAAPPKQSEQPKPEVDDQPTPKAETEQASKPEPVPTNKVAELPKEAQPVEPDPTPKPTPPQPAPKAPAPPQQATQPTESDAPEFASLPEAGPTPTVRPQPPQPKTAETPERKKPDQPVEAAKKPDKTEEEKPQKTAKASSAKKSDFDADKIAALLNRETPQGGGAKRSTQEASLGGLKTTGGSKLTQSEMDALRGQIQKNWNIIPGMADGQDVRIQVTMRLDPSGAIVGQPEVTATGGSESTRETLAGSARRAVLMSSPFQGLPSDKYDAWSEVVVNFDPSQMY
ncbi:MAG: hypothetical protein ACTHJ3_14110 [Pararhizobium sp.]